MRRGASSSAVLTDIGADPDDQQSMIRLMVYANEFDSELLIATGAGAPGELKEAITRRILFARFSTPMAWSCPTCSSTPRGGRPPNRSAHE